MRRAALLLLLAACAPEPGPPDSLVDRPRVIAIKAIPPEVQPGVSASFQVLAVGPSGPLDSSSATWAVCRDPLPLTDTGTVAAACLGNLPAVAQGAGPSIATSSDACAIFGPVPSSTTRRPRNPDATGGFFQPVRVETSGVTAFAQERLICPLTQAPLVVAADFQNRYVPNQNPAIASFEASAPLDSVAKGARLQLTVTWDPSSAEVFPVYDPVNQRLVDTPEVMSVTWYATGGLMAQDRTGPTGPSSSSNVWTAPLGPGPVVLWAVLRDSRGGLDAASLEAQIGP
jgi:hypothetical protein